MSTYVEYVIWAGVPSDDLSTPDAEALEALCADNKSSFSHERLRYEFCEVYMHGEEIGCGVIIKTLDWEPSLAEENEYNPTEAKVAKAILKIVKAKFKELGIVAIPRLYHHIDLGG